MSVIRRFPELVPQSLHAAFNIQPPVPVRSVSYPWFSFRKMIFIFSMFFFVTEKGTYLGGSAAARRNCRGALLRLPSPQGGLKVTSIVLSLDLHAHFCLSLFQMIKRAQRAEHLKELGILDASMNSLSSGTSSALYYGTGLGKGGGVALHSATASQPSREEDDDVRTGVTPFCIQFLIKCTRFELVLTGLHHGP